jgi:hypothetical protein
LKRVFHKMSYHLSMSSFSVTWIEVHFSRSIGYTCGADICRGSLNAWFYLHLHQIFDVLAQDWVLGLALQVLLLYLGIMARDRQPWRTPQVGHMTTICSTATLLWLSDDRHVQVRRLSSLIDQMPVLGRKDSALCRSDGRHMYLRWPL